jgi:hypothetical protein
MGALVTIYGLPGTFDDGAVWWGWLGGGQWVPYVFVAAGIIVMLSTAAVVFGGHRSLGADGARVLTGTLEESRPLPPVIDPTPSPEPEPVPEERRFVGVTPFYLVSLFVNLTDQQAKPLIRPYIGKWLKVSGQLGDVLSNRETISQVTFNDAGPFSDPYKQPYRPYTVYMYFDRAGWDSSLEVLPVGSDIAVIGRITRIDRHSVHLEDCELVE